MPNLFYILLQEIKSKPFSPLVYVWQLGRAERRGDTELPENNYAGLSEIYCNFVWGRGASPLLGLG